jgi:hypothetical protein
MAEVEAGLTHSAAYRCHRIWLARLPGAKKSWWLTWEIVDNAAAAAFK